MSQEKGIVKYLVKLRFDVEGVVEKADLIGAIFGQTEGLFGPEMNLQELQKTWKVGRIEINLQSSNGKTSGEVLIPMSTDVSTAALIAAAVENVDKVGPCSARFQLGGITDVRADRRKVIVDRAKSIMKDWASKTSSEGEESLKDIVDSAKKARLITFGKEGLPAGPAVSSSDTVIVVEGRADVINLLRAGVENTIAVEGTSVPETVKDLARRGKTLYAFLDGDRGGDLILKELSQVARIDRVFRAPRGREVEELTPVEILDILRERPQPEREPEMEEREESRDHGRERQGRYDRGGGSRYPRRDRDRGRGPRERQDYQYEERPPEREPVEQPQMPPSAPMNPEAAEKVKSEYSTLNGTLEAKVFDSSWNELSKMPVNELVTKIGESAGAKHLVFDGIITQRLIDAASKVGIESIVGHRAGEIQSKPETVQVYSFKDLGLE
ncbi:MAG: DNA primase DnaG [Thaumarchaeota archaeon]|nr:DNA primase DnaG [Nitrososphaerota archaeon]